MGWDVGATGLKIVLGAEVPELVVKYLGDDVAALLGRHGLEIDDVARWICHPGGPKVIEAIQATLGLDRDDLPLTWESLDRIGNLSSASVLHVLRDTLAERPGAPGDWGVDGHGPRVLLRAGAAAVVSQWCFTVLVALVGLERLAELVVAKRNLAWSLARGGREAGFGHYPFMVVLHTGLLAGCLVEVWVGDRPFVPALGWPMLALVVARQALALVVHPHARAAVEHPHRRRAGPAADHRRPVPALPHPNYVAVVVEGFALPLVHTRGSPRWCSPCSTPGCCPCASGPRTPRSLVGLCMTCSWSAAGRPGSPSRSAPPARAGRRGRREAAGRHRQGLRRGADARRGARAAGARRRPARRSTSRHHLPAGRAVRRRPLRRRRRSRGAPGVLHDALRGAAVAAGVRIETGTVTDVEQTADDVRVGGLRARYLVAADGLHSPVRAALGLGAADRRPPRWGLRRHFAVPDVGDTVEVTWAPRRRGLRDPGRRDTDRGRRADRHGAAASTSSWRRSPRWPSGCAGAAPASTVRGAGPLRQRCRPASPGGCCSSVTPRATSTRSPARGSHWRSPRPASWCGACARPPRRLRAGLGPRVAALALDHRGPALGAHPRPTSDRIVPLAARAPRVFGTAVNQLAR